MVNGLWRNLISCFLVIVICSWSFYIYIYAFSRRFYPKRLTVHSGYTCIVSSVFPGNWAHNLCAANAILYHWATETSSSLFTVVSSWSSVTTLSSTSNLSCHLKFFKHAMHLHCPFSLSLVLSNNKTITFITIFPCSHSWPHMPFLQFTYYIRHKTL